MSATLYRQDKFMCRLTGFTDTSHYQNYDKSATIDAMRDSLRRGGPDGHGSWVSDSVAIGHVRLSILDLSSGGHQPMIRSPLVLVWNGELYNYRELRTELIALGFEFKSQSDTEVAIQAFRAWGMRAVERFSGIFAFALWDETRQTLLLGRDPMGIKPLYWYRKEHLFMFASELKAFHEHPHFDRSPDTESVAHFLRQGYIHAPFSIFKHVRKLQPGDLLEWKPETATLTIQQYWRPDTGLYEQPTFDGSEQEALEQLDSKLKNSLRQQLASDVPIGVFLSGGIDSSTLAALTQEVSGTPVSTFTIGFEQPGFNEAPHARSVARHLGTDHHEAYCTTRDFTDCLPFYPEVYDEPFGDSSGIPSLLLSKMTGDTTKVAFSADGADELFGGYAKYDMAWRIYPKLHRTRLTGKAIRRLLALFSPDSAAKLASYLPPNRRPWNMEGKFEKGMRALRADNWEECFHIASSTSDRSLLGALTRSPLPSRHPGLRDHPNERRLAALALIDLHTYLEGDILVKMDRAGMYNALEVREPFLDTTVVSFALSLPDHFKIRGLTSKYLLRKLLYRHVPRQIADRPKQGFAVPLAEWLHGILRDELLDIRNRKAVHRLLGLDSNLINSLLNDFLRKKSTVNATLIWYLYVLHAWHDRWCS